MVGYRSIIFWTLIIVQKICDLFSSIVQLACQLANLQTSLSLHPELLSLASLFVCSNEGKEKSYEKNIGLTAHDIVHIIIL